MMHVIGHHVHINIRQSYTAKIPVTEEYEQEQRSLYSQGLFPNILIDFNFIQL